MLARIWRNWNSYVLLVGTQNGVKCCKMCSFFRKLQKRTAIRLSSPCLGIYPHLGIYPKEVKSGRCRDVCTPVHHVHKSPTVRTIQVPLADEQEREPGLPAVTVIQPLQAGRPGMGYPRVDLAGEMLSERGSRGTDTPDPLP